MNRKEFILLNLTLISGLIIKGSRNNLLFNNEYTNLDFESTKKPPNLFVLKQNAEGIFTEEMIIKVLNDGFDYIKFDAKQWIIEYSKAKKDPIHNLWNIIFLDKINWGNLNREIVFDFSECDIECKPDMQNLKRSISVFFLNSCRSINFKLKKVTGDKYLREFKPENNEKLMEGTTFISMKYGCVNISVSEAKDTSGFMADLFSSNGYGAFILAWNPNFNMQNDCSYQTAFFDIDLSKTDDGSFAMMGGVGYNRILKLNMDKVVYKFIDVEGNETSILSKYLQIEHFPINVKKIAVQVWSIDGRTDSKTTFGLQMVYRPSRSLNIKNVYMHDYHRGSISNLGIDSLVENCIFENTSHYHDKPEFADSTRYGIDYEDVIGKKSAIIGNTFIKKFHSILIPAAVNIIIKRNVFIDTYFSIWIYNVIYGEISENTGDGTFHLGTGNDKGLIKFFNNNLTGNLELTKAGEFFKNTMKGGKLSGNGFCHDNIFNEIDFWRVVWDENIIKNTFNNSKGYLQYGLKIYQNIFNNCEFQYNSTDEKDILFQDIIFNGGKIKAYSPFQNTIFRNTKLNGLQIDNTIDNKSEDIQLGSFYFDRCEINIDEIFLSIYNDNKNQGIEIYFKNCIIKGNGQLTELHSLGKIKKLIIDNTNFENIIIPNLSKKRSVNVPK